MCKSTALRVVGVIQTSFTNFTTHCCRLPVLSPFGDSQEKLAAFDYLTERFIFEGDALDYALFDYDINVATSACSAA